MQPEAGQVELSFTMTVDDVRHGFRVQSKATVARRLVRYVYVGGLVVVGLLMIPMIGFAVTDGLDPESVRTIGIIVVALGMVVGIRLYQRRVFAQLAARIGDARVSVDDEAVRTSNADTTSVSAWPAFGGYTETDQAFVLSTADRSWSAFLVLPKRGLAQPADADRLRTILDRHLSRSGRARQD